MLISIIVFFILAHLIISVFFTHVVNSYMDIAQGLIDRHTYTDGCSTPFKNYIHKWLSYSHTLCAAHDFGGLGLIFGVRAGWHNNWINWLSHMSQSSPIYWLWGTVVAIVTLPWVVFKRDLGQDWLPIAPFHGMLLLGTVVGVLIWIQ